MLGEDHVTTTDAGSEKAIAVKSVAKSAAPRSTTKRASRPIKAAKPKAWPSTTKKTRPRRAAARTKPSEVRKDEELTSGGEKSPIQLPTPESSLSHSANGEQQSSRDETPSAGAAGVHLATTNMDDAVEMDDFDDDSSVLSSVPDDLDMSTPHALRTKVDDPGSQHIGQPRRKRSVRPIERFGQFIETGKVVGEGEEDSTGITAPEPMDIDTAHMAIDQNHAKDQAHDLVSASVLPTPPPSAARKRKVSSTDFDAPNSQHIAAPSRTIILRMDPKKMLECAEKSSSQQPAEKRRTRSRGSDEEAAFAPVVRKPRARVRTKSTQLEPSGTPTRITKRPTKKSQGDALFPTPTAPDGAELMNLSDLPAHIDPILAAISQKLCSRQSISLKPEPQGRPEVWADSRQALCETVPYFKMPQSGCHQNDRHVYAFLFDGISHCREYMDTDIIIARAGGGMEQDVSGQMLQKKDHTMGESQVQAVLNDIQLQNPLVIICGSKNAGAVCRMPHRYNILGWYKPVAVWAEKTSGKGGKAFITIKYRFERLDTSKQAWYAPLRTEKELTTAERDMLQPLVRRTCDACSQTYPAVYLDGWMCLNAHCEDFWKLETGEWAPYGRLLYNPAFLLDRTTWAREEEPYSVRPPIPYVGSMVGDNLTYINTRGICCPECGRCSQRRLFKGWKCDNPDCTYQNFPKHIPVKPPMLHLPWESVGDGPALTRNKHERGVNVSIEHRLGFKVFTYTFRGVEGRLVHAVSNAKINRTANGPDDMFAAMQQQDDPAMDLHLERRKFGSSTKAENPQTGPVPGLQQPSLTKAEQAPRDNDPMRTAWHNVQQEQQRCAEKSEEFRESVASTLFTRFGLDSCQDKSAPSRRHSGIDAENEALITKMLNGSEGMFGQLQENLPRQSKPMPALAATEDDSVYMSAFAINYGMPYKFVASGVSLPFTGSPWPIRACRADLNWASQNFLDPHGHQDLNELLVFAYMEGQKIEYHDDGESGLGPRIATMSLGGKAKMHLRMKSKHYTGCSKGTGILTADRPLPGSIEYEKRLAAWQDLQLLKTTDRRQYEQRRKELPKELKIYEKRTKKAEDLVTITLNHGDIVLMEGYEIQQYLEHKVVPEGCLRFALTCRTVLPDHLEPHELPSYDVEPDDPRMSSLFRRDESERAKGAEVVVSEDGA